MTTIRRTGPCGLRIEMRSDERGLNPAVLSVPNAVDVMPQGQRGGCGMDFRPFLPPATLVYLTHFAVVSRFETALSLRPRAACRESRERPPQNRGVMRSFTDGIGDMPLYRPPWGRSRLIYPCGKAWKNPPFPSRLIVPDRSSPSRVRFAASRPGPLRADPKG